MQMVKGSYKSDNMQNSKENKMNTSNHKQKRILRSGHYLGETELLRNLE